MSGGQHGETQRRTEPISASSIRVYQQGLGANASQPSLLLIHREGMAVIPLPADRSLLVGAESHVDICIPDVTLSGEHARVSPAEGGVLIEDLESLNGVWVAGTRVPFALLKPGQEVMLGRVLVRLRGASDAGEIAPAELDSNDLVAGEGLQTLLQMARKVARAQASVVIHGETGSGKELIARYLHTHSDRAQAPLVSVNCGAIPATLLESTLFGHERGAFTGAHKQQAGVFESADNGVVFLDEVAELPAAAQAALLHVLETGRFCRVGSVQERRCDVRVLAASHRDLLAMTHDGTFRTDLYYRLSTITLEVPPLRDRPADIEPLAKHLLRKANQANARTVSGLSAATLARLKAYRWPGNVRELRNVIERAVIVCDGHEITPEDLPTALQASEPEPVSSSGLRDRMQAYEAQLIADALEQSGHNRRAAAKLLNIPLRTLSHKIKQLGLERS